MGKRIIRNADLLKKAQDAMNKAQDSTNNAESQNSAQEEIIPEHVTPTIEQINDICPYVPTCQDDWNNREWNDVCTESDYKEFIEIIQPFCIKNPDFADCGDCIL